MTFFYLMISFPNSIILVLFLILFLLFVFKPKFNRHSHNIKKSKKILDMINSFEHPGQKFSYLRKIDPFVFEEVLLEAFHNKGYKVIRNKKYTGDGGVDGVIFDKKGKKILIQAKRYSSYVNLQHIKNFNILVTNSNAAQGYFVHTGKTGSGSNQYVNFSNVKIISGTKLLDLLK